MTSRHLFEVTPDRSVGGRRYAMCENPASPVPKLGPPLNARPDQRCPCMTPALTSSKNRYNESWNLSFTRAALIATYIARARGECMCVFTRNLFSR